MDAQGSDEEQNDDDEQSDDEASGDGDDHDEEEDNDDENAKSADAGNGDDDEEDILLNDADLMRVLEEADDLDPSVLVHTEEADNALGKLLQRSEERRVGKERVRK